MGRKSSPGKDLKKFALLSSLALMIPSSIAVGLFIGYMLDRIFNTQPWLLLAFMILGTISGFLGFFRGLSKYGNEENENE
ncbi:MAG: AtpZ/AtpI family protein [Candidatus Aminicenantales bacterium]